MTGWVSGPRRAPPRVLARTCSARAGVALHRGGPCGAPEPLEAHPSPGTCPMCTPRGGGRSTRGVAAARAREDPAPGTGRRREGAHCTPARSSRCGGRPLAKAQHAHARLRARRARRMGAGQPHGPWLPPAPTKTPRRATETPVLGGRRGGFESCTPCKVCAPRRGAKSQGWVGDFSLSPPRKKHPEAPLYPFL